MLAHRVKPQSELMGDHESAAETTAPRAERRGVTEWIASTASLDKALEEYRKSMSDSEKLLAGITLDVSPIAETLDKIVIPEYPECEVDFFASRAGNGTVKPPQIRRNASARCFQGSSSISKNWQV